MFKSHDSNQRLQRKGIFEGNASQAELVIKCDTTNTLTIGAAISDGDCLFDSIAQTLNQNNPGLNHSAESLRQRISEYLDTPRAAWVQKKVEADNKNYRDYKNLVGLTAAKAALIGKIAIWGRADIEGRILCEIFNLKLHLIEAREEIKDEEGHIIIPALLHHLVTAEGESVIDEGKIEKVEPNTVYLVNDSQSLHFVPLLLKQAPELSSLPRTLTPPVEIPVEVALYQEAYETEGIKGLFTILNTMDVEQLKQTVYQIKDLGLPIELTLSVILCFLSKNGSLPMKSLGIFVEDTKLTYKIITENLSAELSLKLFGLISHHSQKFCFEAFRSLSTTQDNDLKTKLRTVLFMFFCFHLEEIDKDQFTPLVHSILRQNAPLFFEKLKTKFTELFNDEKVRPLEHRVIEEFAKKYDPDIIASLYSNSALNFAFLATLQMLKSDHAIYAKSLVGDYFIPTHTRRSEKAASRDNTQKQDLAFYLAILMTQGLDALEDNIQSLSPSDLLKLGKDCISAQNHPNNQTIAPMLTLIARSCVAYRILKISNHVDALKINLISISQTNGDLEHLSYVFSKVVEKSPYVDEAFKAWADPFILSEHKAGVNAVYLPSRSTENTSRNNNNNNNSPFRGKFERGSSSRGHQ